MENIKLTVTNAQYSILSPVLSTPRLDRLWLTDDNRDVSRFLYDTPFDDILAFDYETTGTKWHSDSTFRIVTIGLSSSVGSLSVDTRNKTKASITKLLLDIFTTSRRKGLQLTAHNLMFEAGVTHAYGISFEEAGWSWDSLGLYHQLANEGFVGQKHGLKNAQKDMLNWTETNEEALDLWLVRNGFCKPLKPDLTEDQREELYNTRDKRGQRKLRPDKGQMFNAPHEILGHYNALDVDATYQLMVDVLMPGVRTVPPQLVSYHKEIFLPNIAILVDLAATGIAVDLATLEAYDKKLETTIGRTIVAIRNLDEVRPILERLEEGKVKAEPTKYVKPKTFWLEKNLELGRTKRKAVKVRRLSTQWKQWKLKQKAVEQYKLTGLVADEYAKAVKEACFNLRSPKQLITLLYENLFGYEIVRPHVDASSKGVIKLNGSDVELTMTKSGGLPANKSAFKQMGEVGEKVGKLLKLLAEKNTVARTIKFAKESPDGRLRPTFRIPGTITGRLAGTDKFNWQNLPNSIEYLKAFIADEGWTIVQADFAALEPHALAELSQDKMYMSLYGPNAAPNLDIYLHVGAFIGKFASAIASAGYSTSGNTIEGLEAAKKECAKQRKILKVIQLASAYGAGAFKIWQSMRLDGIEITPNEVEQIVEEYWSDKVFGGVKKFEQKLMEEWRENGGWVLNAMGRPVAVADNKKKDCVNRVIQSSGHDILQLLIRLLRDNMAEEGIPVRWIIPDLHDETIYSVPNEYVEKALQVHRDTVEQLNKLLDGTVKFRMEPKTMASLADRKD